MINKIIKDGLIHHFEGMNLLEQGLKRKERSG